MRKKVNLPAETWHGYCPQGSHHMVVKDVFKAPHNGVEALHVAAECDKCVIVFTYIGRRKETIH